MNSHANKRQIYICHGTGCISSGSLDIRKTIEDEIKNKGLEVEIVPTGCHGFCQRGPILIVEPDGIFYSQLTVEDAKEIVDSHILNNKPVERLFYVDPLTGEKIAGYKEIPFYSKQHRLILKNCGHINPENIDDYISVGGYQALKKALTDFSPEGVINEIKKAGLRGRGGAGFPTALKWELCRKSKSDKKYVVCNADEGDPGAFMDRSILEADPHSVIEGLAIAAYSVGADEGYIYVRAEYPLAVKRLRIAISQAEERGYLGENIFGTDFNFRINIMEGAGAFVCGEETALIASIEGRSGRPRPRPPFPVQSGLWGKPTTINNVKTLASVTRILQNGSDWYRKIGTESCPGTAVFALTGQVSNIGLVEVPMGTTLKEIIFEIGGGIPKGKKFKAVQTGGPSGGCLPAKFLDLPVDYQSLTQAGSMMGSGGMVVMDEDTCIVDVARYFLDFAQKESCGECVPCRLGTKQMLTILENITKGKGKPEDIDLLLELAEGIKLGSLCGLGKTAPNPILTTIRYFREEYEAHVVKKRCPAVVCKEIISSPCQHTCPIETEAATYIGLIANGKYKEGFEVILKDNPLPSVVARVCHHPCETKCQAGKWGEPISIRNLKRFLTDYAIKNGLYPFQKSRESKKSPQREESIAIIGSGPAGLTAGYFLAKKGYNVTIFEASEVIGGALALCIPEYRLPRSILEIDINHILSSGVNIKTNTEVGKDITFEELKNCYDAIFIATGAYKSRKLRIENEDAEGVIDAIEFLKNVNLRKPVRLGRRVGIIGGGNAAVDAARCAIRLDGVEKVTIFYRRTIDEMPAFKEEIEAALEEGIEIQFLCAPVRIITENGKLREVELVKMELGEFDESQRRRPIPVEGSNFLKEIDTLIVAIGQDPNLSFLKNINGIEVSRRQTLVVDQETLISSLPGVFGGGDAVTGANTVIDAIAAGRKASEMIDKYLSGEELKPEYRLTRPSMYPEPVELTEEEIEEARRAETPHLPVDKRTKNFDEVEKTLDEKTAIKEARRCLRCDLETEDAKKALEEKSQNTAGVK